MRNKFMRKMRKVSAVVLSFALCLGFAITASAADRTFYLSPNGNGAFYALEVYLKATSYWDGFSPTIPGGTSSDYYLLNGDDITLSKNMLPGGAVKLSAPLATGGTLQATVQESELMTSYGVTPLDGKSTTLKVSGREGYTNELYSGYSLIRTNDLIWHGKLVFSDPTKNPTSLGLDTTKILGYDFGNSNVVIEKITTLNKTTTAQYPNTTATPPKTVYFDKLDTTALNAPRITTVSGSKTFDVDKVIDLRAYVNNGMGFSLSDKTDLLGAQNFRLTLRLKEKYTGYTGTAYFQTDIVSEPYSFLLNNGATSVTITPPASYFYNERWAGAYGTDAVLSTALFRSMPAMTDITLMFTPGTGAIYPGGTPTPVPTPSPTPTPTPSSPSDENVDTGASDDLALNWDTVTLNPGATMYLVSADNTAKWYTSNKNVVTVYTSGKIKAVRAGTATIKAKNASGDEAVCVVTVKPSTKPITSFKLKNTTGTVYVGSQYAIGKYTLSPTGYTDTISWTTSDPTVASVDQKGTVNVVGTGKATITAITSSGRQSYCVLTAKNPTISLKASSGTVRTGGRLNISLSAKPASSTVTFESMNESIAIVNSSGVVTGVNPGTTKIEITSSKGIVKMFTITVS
ncbi:hypothetical protein FACS189499_03330 [Clostridia bacterium]|nr:hypothetical protein FACS189499_03330 [Clostridia bacterium]